MAKQRDTYRLTAEERRAARVAGIAGQQQNLKREAAERRAKRARQAEPRAAEARTPNAAPAPSAHSPGPVARQDSPPGAG